MNKMVLFFIFAICLFTAPSVWSLERIATVEDVAKLKEDLLNGKVKLSRTTLDEIKYKYGSSTNIKEEDLSLTYDYGDIKVEFEKVKYLMDWKYDSSKAPAYTDDIDQLRKDLESKEIDGKQISLVKTVKDYGIPTETGPVTDEKFFSYYYGDIKLTFEQFVFVKNWKATGISIAKPGYGGISSTKAPAPAVPQKPKAETKEPMAKADETKK